MRKRKKFSFIGMILLLVMLVAACGNNSGVEDESQSVIRIGSKDFTENLIVSEIYALSLEDHGYQVERNPSIASAVIHTAIVNNEIDLYPEYTGTGLLAILKLPMETDAVTVFNTVKAKYAEDFDLTWLDYAEVNDSQGLVIRTDIANELNIYTITDLQKNASKLRFASQGEFDQREDGIVGLEKMYGDFNWKSSTIYDNSLKYEVLKNNEADVTPAYTTEGQLVNTEEFTVLEDDQKFWPPYNIAPVIRNNVLADNPDIETILNNINEKLDTSKMIELNAKVDVDGEEYEDVAKEFFESLD